MLPSTNSERERSQTFKDFKKRSNTNPKKSNFAPSPSVKDSGSGKVSYSPHQSSSDFNKDNNFKAQSEESIDILEDQIAIAENEEQFIAEKIKNIAERQYKVQTKKETFPRTFSF